LTFLLGVNDAPIITQHGLAIDKILLQILQKYNEML